MAKKRSIRDLGQVLETQNKKKEDEGEVSTVDDIVEDSKSKHQATSARALSRVMTPLDSPANNVSLRKRTVEPTRSGQRLVLPLPITGKDISCGHKELDPEDCYPSSINPRNQSLLSLTDPYVARLKIAIEMHGQRDPVLARPIADENGRLKYEVIYGTTRLFVAKSLKAEKGGDFKLRAWVADVPDADLRALARSENNDRRELSAWEIASDLKSSYESIYKGKTYDFIAEQEGLKKSTVGNYLQLSELPKHVVELVVSPQEISLRSGLQLNTLLQPLPDPKQGEVIGKVSSYGLFDSSNDLLKALRAELKSEEAPLTIPKKKPLQLKSTKSDLTVKITAHRSNEGQFKVDLHGMNDQQVESLVEILKKNFSLK